MILLLVLVVVALLSLAGYTFCQLMQAEREAVELAGRQAQVRALAESGLEQARYFVGQERQAQTDAGGCFDNASRFRGVAVVNVPQARDRGRFTLVAPKQENGQFSGIRFGLEDQSNRLNLNSVIEWEKKTKGAGQKVLMVLPGMTEQIADAILDWMDDDDEPRENGAEREYYGSLDPPYAPRNGPPATIEELLQVRGVTPAMLFGSDANRNGLVDRNEADPQSLEGVDNADGSMNRGWAAYLTVHSVEKNVQSDSKPKVNVNQKDMQKLYDQLKEAMDSEKAEFIVLYKQSGSQGTTKPEVPLKLDQSGSRTLTSVLDLIGAQITVKNVDNNGKDETRQSPFPKDPGMMIAYLPKLMDTLTTKSDATIAGRINVNQSPKVVLDALRALVPELTSENVEQILSQRKENPAEDEPNRRHATWILAVGIDLETMKKLEPYVNAGGNVFRAEAVGYFDEGGPAARIEAILDATARPTRMVFWRDISHLGRGYPVEMLGTEEDATQPADPALTPNP